MQLKYIWTLLGLTFEPAGLFYFTLNLKVYMNYMYVCINRHDLH